MYYGEIKTCDIANGVGVRVTLFVSGCTNHCYNCFQPQTWDFHYGKPFDAAAEQVIFAELEKPFIRGLTLLGGDPFEPENQRALVPFLRRVRARFPEKDIWAYSGSATSVCAFAARKTSASLTWTGPARRAASYSGRV